MKPDQPVILGSAALMDAVNQALAHNRPLSVVSVGATEAFVMAQYTIFSEEEILRHPEALVANWGIREGFFHRGIRFPNVAARDEAVDAVRQADIVGYNTIVEPARRLAGEVFAFYDIKPALVFEAHVRRVIMFSQQEKFQAMLAGRRLLLIGARTPEIKRKLETRYLRSYRCQIVGAISIGDYGEIKKVKDDIAKYDFDICLLAAGTSALILAPYISRRLGRVAFDIGSGMTSLATGKIVLDDWIARIIGIDNIMKM